MVLLFVFSRTLDAKNTILMVNQHLILELYLINIKQHVRINNELCEETLIMSGVPQGTTLSLTLFNMHINQINYLSTYGK